MKGRRATCIVPNYPKKYGYYFIFQYFAGGASRNYINGVTRVPYRVEYSKYNGSRRYQGPFVVTSACRRRYMRGQRRPQGRSRPKAVAPPFLYFYTVSSSSMGPKRAYVGGNGCKVSRADCADYGADRVHRGYRGMGYLSVARGGGSNVAGAGRVFRNVYGALFLFQVLFQCFVFARFLSPFTIFYKTNRFRGFALPLVIVM